MGGISGFFKTIMAWYPLELDVSDATHEPACSDDNFFRQKLAVSCIQYSG